jgi:hypothetical protein
LSPEEKYTSEIKTSLFHGKKINVVHLTPVLSPDQKARRKREIESQLYDVFSKYPKA